MMIPSSASPFLLPKCGSCSGGSLAFMSGLSSWDLFNLIRTSKESTFVHLFLWTCQGSLCCQWNLGLSFRQIWSRSSNDITSDLVSLVLSVTCWQCHPQAPKDGLPLPPYVAPPRLSSRSPVPHILRPHHPRKDTVSFRSRKGQLLSVPEKRLLLCHWLWLNYVP